MTVGKINVKTAAMCGSLGIFTAVLSAYILGFIMPAFPELMEQYSADIEALIKSSVTLLLYVLILAPIIEEALFRYLIFNIIRKFLKDRWAIIIQAVLFGLYHGNIVQIIYAFLLGLLLGWIRAKTEHLLYCLIFHCLFNITGVMLDNFAKTEQTLYMSVLMPLLTFAASVYIVWSINRSYGGCDQQTDL